MRIAVLMTCHNRKETTVRCLRRLLPQLGGEDRVFLVDDGSTDGTGREIVRLFDCSIVRLIKGDGTLYWAKGMALAWKVAEEEGSFDFYLWLNDDVMLKEHAFACVIEDWQNCGDERGVIVGACSEDESESRCSYGPTDINRRLMPPTGRIQLAEGWFAGNFVLIPRQTCICVGRISDEYSHARADFDYAERLKLAGIPFFCASHYIGSCRREDAEKMKGKNLFERVRLMWSPGYCNLHDLWLIRRRYHGLVRAIISCMHLIFDVVKG